MTRSKHESEHYTLVEHLQELRDRLIKILWIILIAAIVCYNFSEILFDFIRGPIAPYLGGKGLVFTAPMDKFMAHVKVAIFAGTLASCPLWFYQLWKFVEPALYEKEKKFSLGFIFSGASLFLIGNLVCYYLVLPAAFQFLMSFGGSIDQPMITIDQYLSFFLMMELVFGVAFELPLVLVILGMIGIVNQKMLKSSRRYAVVVLAVVSAVLTPSPDAVSMLLLLVPLVILYEIAVILVGFFERRNQQSI